MLVLSLIFLLGVGSGCYFNLNPGGVGNLVMGLLCLLVFFVGFSISQQRGIYSKVKKDKLIIFLFPIVSLFGSVLAGILVSLFLEEINLIQSALVTASMGFYSLPSVLVSVNGGAYLGTLVLIANILREVLTLFFAPLLVRLFGRRAPIAAGGATTMDVSLGVIMQNSGKEYVVFSLINGILLTIFVPVIINLLLNFL
jgi:uncharacterized membrane protein YbjE (DUF340 family)